MAICAKKTLIEKKLLLQLARFFIEAFMNCVELIDPKTFSHFSNHGIFREYFFKRDDLKVAVGVARLPEVHADRRRRICLRWLNHCASVLA